MGMKCVHTFGTGRHKRQADITLLFQYISMNKRDLDRQKHAMMTMVMVTLMIK